MYPEASNEASQAFFQQILELNFAFSCDIFFLGRKKAIYTPVYTSDKEAITETSCFMEAIAQFCGVFSAAGFEHKPSLTLT